MLPLLHGGRPPLGNGSCLRLLRRCVGSTTRIMSYAPTRPERERGFVDPQKLPLENQELLNSMHGPDHDVWRKGDAFPGLGSSGENLLLDPVGTMPKVVWPESVSETDEYWKKKKDQQMKLEQNTVYESLEQYQKFVKDVRKREQVATLPASRQLVHHWFQPLCEAIQDEQDKVLKSTRSPPAARQYVLLLKPDELAVLTIHSVMGSTLRGDTDRPHDERTPFVDVATRLGKAVQAQVNLLKLKQRIVSSNKRRKELNKYIEEMQGIPSRKIKGPEDAVEWERRLLKRAVEMESKIRLLKNRWTRKNVTIKDVSLSQWTLRKEQAKWDESIVVQVGALLINLFKQSATVRIDKTTGKFMGSGATSICANEPVLKHEVVWRRGRKAPRSMGVVSIHPSVIKVIESSGAHQSLFWTRSYPMVYPPDEWRGYDMGAYLWTPSRVIRSLEHAEPALLVKRVDGTGQLKRVYQALTILGRTAWVMNKEVFAVLEQVWNAGGGKLGLPTRTNVEIPAERRPSFKLCEHNGALHISFTGETQQETYFRKGETFRAKKKNAELHSLRCDVELKLGVARKFLDEDQLYFPHNMDFRGRAYPIPPHLNHLGNDMCRGLLLFAEGRPLGSSGLDWLYIQIANLYGAGENKKKVEERLKFGMRNLDKILDSANNPLGGLQWWMNGDSPWQLLATCIDIRNALNSDDPEHYLSRMHIHQDGSCNGLQHYAALGRDTPGAGAVNLRRADAPNDVYTEVSQIVSRIVTEDAAKGNKWARILDGHVDRKLVKQSVMTSVYGVTFIGAREQISNRLKERGWEDNEDLFAVSAYAARVTMAGLHEMFRNAKDVMHWLADCANRIAATGKIVQWTTPLGLPVGQPYRTREKYCVRTLLQEISLTRYRDSQPVIKRRQRSAFPPNYIHSLDSTHMMMTALGCHEKNVTFAGVHDSFWTHAGTVDEMNVILREKFYELHSQPLLEQLSEQFKATYNTTVPDFPEVPKLGDLDLKEIYDAPYFFN